MITKFAALAALDDALTRRCNHLCDVYFITGHEQPLLALLHGLELASQDYRKAKAAIDDARNLACDEGGEAW